MTIFYTLSFSYPDRAGIIAEFSGAILEHRGNIQVLNQFIDPDTGLFSCAWCS